MRDRLLLAAVLLAVTFLVSEVLTQQNANPTIPQHLLPCYRNPEIYMRENRYKNTFRIFIDFIKRIERSRGGQQKSARELSMALLYHLRLDGIQPTPNVPQTQHVTPFAPGGNNYYKHRFTLVGLLPKPNRPMNYDFFNESLSEFDMCNLHFMLSYSIDPYKRENEDCSAIKFEDNNSFKQGYDSGYYGYRHDTFRSRPMRHRRQVEDTDRRRERSIDDKIRNIRRRLEIMKRKRNALKMSRYRRSLPQEKEENLRKEDVEVIPAKILESLSNSKNDPTPEKKRGEFTLGHQDFLGPGEDHIMRGGYERMVPSRTYEGNVYKRTALYNGNQYNWDTSRVLIPGLVLSDCPIENGVIKHKYGSVTIGAVIAGIAAGFNHQKISLAEFNAELKGPLAGEKINNIWAATLAGNAADLILSLGLISNLRDGVGLRGGWNHLISPKYYMLEKGKLDYFTDVELRGALDGLWLGLTVQQFNKALSSYPLSSILEMYYSDDGFPFNRKVRASARGDEVTSYAPTEEFKKQLHLLAAVMKNQRVNTVTYSDFSGAVSDVVAAINNYIPQLSQKRRSWSAPPQSRLYIDPRVDLAVVFDPTWDHFSLQYYIERFIDEELGATPGQSNMTLICPFDLNSVYPISDSAEFDAHFIQIYEDCKRKAQGINYRLLHEQLIDHYSKVLIQENMYREIIPHSHVALIIISDSQRPPDPEMIYEEQERIRHYIPGIEMLVATNGPADKFRDLVISPEKDIFTLRAWSDSSPEPDAEDLLDRIARVPRRISNPARGESFGNWSFYEGDANLNDNVRPDRTVVYRIDPVYLFNSKDVKLNVRTKGRVVRVCQAREQNQLPPYMQRGFNAQDSYPDVPPYPDFPASDDDRNGQEQCKKGTTVSFDFENLCEDAGSVAECRPLFITLQPSLEDKLEMNCVGCRFPANVEYNIKVSGLTGSSASAVVMSLSLLLLCSIASSLSSKFY